MTEPIGAQILAPSKNGIARVWVPPTGTATSGCEVVAAGVIGAWIFPTSPCHRWALAGGICRSGLRIADGVRNGHALGSETHNLAAFGRVGDGNGLGHVDGLPRTTRT